MQQKRSYGRMSRINEEVRRVLSEILRDRIRDPRIDNRLISVLKAEVTKDLKYCKVSVTVLGDAEARQSAGEALKSAKSFIRRELAQELNLRNTPELSFIMDDSIEYSIRIEKLLADNAPAPLEEPEGEEEEAGEETEAEE